MKRYAVLIASSLLLSACATVQEEPIPVMATTADPDSAEGRTRTALERIEALNPRLNAVIAVDPTALDQARALDRAMTRQGPLFGMPILIKDNIETAGTAADHRRQPGAARQRHQSRRAAGRAAARGRRGDRRQGQSVGMGEHPLEQFDLGLERGRRPGPQPARAQPQSLRLELGQRRRGRGRHGAGGDRHRDRRLDHLPVGDQRHRRLQADRRPGQPHSCRADQPQPGHARADDAHRPRRRPDHERDRRHRSRRSGDRRGRRPPRGLCGTSVARRPARRPPRGDALRFRLRHQSGARGGAGDAARAGRRAGRHHRICRRARRSAATSSSCCCAN